jgi:predicted RNA-binding Zn-ribbon protein involved in translation (DUF1610 family)
MKKLITQLKKDYPDLQFVAGDVFSWSSQQQTVFYVSDRDNQSAVWSLLHEVGHATLNHTNYHNDFALLQMEVAAWTAAKELADRYGHKIDEDHIQDCLDTYRDWLHQRSSCPTCSNVSLQKDARTYQCFNCGEEWHVAQNRHCRPYRRKTDKQKQPV